MTGYGAVISLKNTIDYILHSSHFSLVDPSPTIIQLAYNELQPLQDTLQRLDSTSPSRSRNKVNDVDERIKERVWELEDSLESLLSQQILPQLQSRGEVGAFPFSIDLQSLQDDANCFIQTLRDMGKDYVYEPDNMAEDDEASSSRIGYDGTKPKMIGLSHLFRGVKRDLMRRRLMRKDMSGLVGMAGVGKTTLAREIFEDAEIMSHFECRAWVTVGRKPQLDKLALGILVQLYGIPPDHEVLTLFEPQLGFSEFFLAMMCGVALGVEVGDGLQETLEGKKCLVVVDDVWEPYVLNSLMS